ncbi:MAG: carbon monoxide dehydrogenase [Hydrogenobacter thermophilus]|uniref:CoxG family protein n=1 Tax=Hydrogenobacter thermophilus TaxID=940 RepID=UPI001C778DFF|nr:SRPBCC domain-containing protein [Hydrogenobacter thermophilus]QWK20180.1 MAG: carbon monoxide dehydrogenase [Hydrogenobacter thermophilus]
MELVVKESFDTKADFKEAWKFFSNPEFIVPCIPGAEIREIKEDGSFEASVKLKLGAVSLNFVGNMKYEKLDEAQGLMVLSGEGKEKGGAGRAKANIEATLKEEGDVLKVSVIATVDISGKILQYGRGMFEQVAKQYFAQFSQCAKNYLETEQSEEKKMPPEPVKVNALNLILKAFLAWLLSPFRRIFGGKA